MQQQRIVNHGSSNRIKRSESIHSRMRKAKRMKAQHPHMTAKIFNQANLKYVCNMQSSAPAQIPATLFAILKPGRSQT